MARPIWSGSISFGLVNIPVKLFSAVRRKNVRFNQIDSKTGSRVKQKRVSAATGEEVEYDDIVKGFELPSGEYVTIDEDELASLDPDAVKTIDLEEFVDLVDIDPIFYDSAYYLAPSPDTQKPYKLLVSAMEESGKVGIARFVMRTKQYLAAIRPVDGRLLLSTMVYADELVASEDVDLFHGIDDIEVSDKEIEMARQLISSLEADFQPEKHTDTYRLAVIDMIDRKIAGEEMVMAAPADEDAGGSVVDLMAALEASVAEAKKARSRHPTAAAKKKPAAKKKAAAKKKPAAKKKAAAKKKSAAKKKAS
ncbi:MAG: Ku protein [Acidimicrobiales bacterium]|nr:Ku protein [Acidimicrobiales bacterium]RZV41508.1 MAG: Ku protein [Acidimicrobiales bacterium]